MALGAPLQLLKLHLVFFHMPSLQDSAPANHPDLRAIQLQLNEMQAQLSALQAEPAVVAAKGPLVYSAATAAQARRGIIK